ncbi:MULTISPECIES: alpha/beta hydrolase [Rubrivivax]|uniref:Alpha/beta hydrolase n=1 Tax=Rubrivivax benzoatilyticus TaxID=316997 RepID=A0ABX0HUQ7_9BURK|nr:MULTISPECIES: alpha/beta hydrolase [Rubrivivax]EGJ09453.1 cysteine proteinase [Rubrivivax benzoatilyticus JA2 = ATCC BAA-35]MCC9596775.1 alpha/beta hydrolase [Rubrivivax sp. JA1055]NHK98765.1 alpha/beta hydrolase [Rubrivivax benzoatilyticus]NHL24267.1 alpha/beta hydrolase [Rubrivivax benzoatilyticus]
MSGRPLRLLAALAALVLAGPAVAATQACRLPGVEHEARCGIVKRALDPARPDGPTVDIHYAVLPAVARRPKPDPVLFLAGGPGQGAIDIAGTVQRLMGRLGSRRDIVLVDLRGTGRSAPLDCADSDPLGPLAAGADPARRLAALKSCRERLQKLPYGDLRFFTTTLAVQDVDAVRRAVGAERIDLVGVSYGTRAALEYQRQFPQAVRRLVLDGVAPPDMVLPAAVSVDAQAALDGLLDACELDTACRARFPALRATWSTLLASLPREVELTHPFTGRRETLAVSRDLVASLVRQALYVPAWTSALPAAIAEAAAGRFDGLFALAFSGLDMRGRGIAQALHFSVICAEDAPRAASGEAPGRDFGSTFADEYAAACRDWPRGEVPPAFYRVVPSPVPALLLSGGADPVTPPRHGARTAAALGPKARHVVAPGAGHGVLAVGCIRDAVFRFIDAETEADALAVDFGCAATLPRPAVFVPPGGPR